MSAVAIAAVTSSSWMGRPKRLRVGRLQGPVRPRRDRRSGPRSSNSLICTMGTRQPASTGRNRSAVWPERWAIAAKNKARRGDTIRMSLHSQPSFRQAPRIRVLIACEISLPRPIRSREWLTVALLECRRCHQVTGRWSSANVPAALRKSGANGVDRPSHVDVRGLIRPPPVLGPMSVPARRLARACTSRQSPQPAQLYRP